MRLSDYTSAYGDLETATHILVQKCSNDNKYQYYCQREYNDQIYNFTYYLDSASYFTLEEFAEDGFREIINNTHPLDKVFFRLINFECYEPYELSKYDLNKYIFKKPKTFSGSFSELIIDIQNEIKSRFHNPYETESVTLQTITKYDETKTIDYKDVVETKSQYIITKGILEPYFEPEINEYSKDILPDQIKTTPAQEGLKYTDKFDHNHEKGKIIKIAKPKINQISVYEHFTSDKTYKKNDPNLTLDDLKIINTSNDNINYTITKPFGKSLLYTPIEKGVKIIDDPIVSELYPELEAGQIILEPKPKINVIPANYIVKHIQETKNLTNLEDIIAPTAHRKITLNTLLNNVLKSKLYNIPIKKINYKAKWFNGVITKLDPKSRFGYETPYQMRTCINSDNLDEYYGVHIDISNVSKRTDIIDSLRNMIIDDIASSTIVPTTISIHFNDKIIVKIEPFTKYYNKNKNVLYINCDEYGMSYKADFTKAKWNQLYSKWANEHKDLIKSNELNQKFDIDSFWSINKNTMRTDKRIEPPVDDVYICYVNFHPTSNDIKIGRSKSWESRYSLYTRTNPPVKTIDPNSILRYYLKCPVHKDSVITNYLYVCMEDFFKQFSDKQPYLKRHKTEKGHVTEYYSINSNLDLNDQLNQYVADLTEAFSNLTLKDLADIRKPSNKDGIHGGKRQEFFNKVNQYTKEQVYNVEQALQIVANLDNTTKFKDYPDFEKLFLPKFKKD